MIGPFRRRLRSDTDSRTKPLSHHLQGGGMHKPPETPPPAYLPAMGHHRLLGLYDPFVKLLGVESLHRALITHAALRRGTASSRSAAARATLRCWSSGATPPSTWLGSIPTRRHSRAPCAKRVARRSSMRLDRGYAEALPYAGASFDRVLSALMFHHLTADVQVTALTRCGASWHRAARSICWISPALIGRQADPFPPAPPR